VAEKALCNAPRAGSKAVPAPVATNWVDRLPVAKSMTKPVAEAEKLALA